MSTAATNDGRVHFIGVGGAGMSAVAYLLTRKGIPVSGSDAADGPYLRALAAAGVDVKVGHDAAHVAGAACVVVTSAVRETNVELVAARQAQIPVIHRSVALVRATEGLRVIAIAGAHGKTTTSAMTVRALHEAGIDATFAIGAPVHGVSGAVGGAYAGTSDVAVIEADESDGSFLAYSPEVAIVTNVEPDHLDHYGTAEALETAFAQFAMRTTTLLTCLDDPGSERLAERVRIEGPRVVTYGLTKRADIVVNRLTVTWGDLSEPLTVPQAGWHNRLNATAAWAAAVSVGADPRRAAAGLATFAGTGRRFELRGSACGVDVYDDYAHHPTEISALVEAARESVSGRMVFLFQPHLYSRTRILAREFAASLTIPDADVILAGVYGAREAPEPGVGAATIGDLVTPPPGGTFRVIEDLRAAAREASRLAVPGGAVFTVGAGSVTEAADWVLDALREREAARA